MFVAWLCVLLLTTAIECLICIVVGEDTDRNWKVFWKVYLERKKSNKIKVCLFLVWGKAG